MADKPNIHQRMFAVMEDMQGSPLVKDNKPGVPYMTLAHDTVTSALRPLFIRHRILTTASVVDHGRDDNLTWAKVDVTFYNIDDPEQFVTVTAFGYGVDNQDKGPGKAISYAVKYAYLKAFCLETTDDPENESIDRKGGSTGKAASPRGGDSVASGEGWDGTAVIKSGKNEGKMWKDLSDRSINFMASEKFDPGKAKDMAKLEKARREMAKAGNAPNPDDLTKQAIIDMVKQLREIEGGGGDDSIAYICEEHGISGSAQDALKKLTSEQLNKLHQDFKDALSGDA